MQALFRGSLTQGMKLVGIFADEQCQRIQAYLQRQPADAYMQFIALKPAAAAVADGGDGCAILASGSLTRGITAIGPYADRGAALSNAVSLSFGNKSSSYFLVEQEAELAPLRDTLRALS